MHLRGFLFCLLTLSVFSCAKEGLGGESTLVIFLQHHGRAIKSHIGYPDTVFVKYGTQDFPGTQASDFSKYFIGVTDEDSIIIKGLKWGNYYLYGAGMDSLGPYRVTGGMPFKIKQSDKKEDVNVDLAVTE